MGSLDGKYREIDPQKVALLGPIPQEGEITNLSQTEIITKEKTKETFEFFKKTFLEYALEKWGWK